MTAPQPHGGYDDVPGDTVAAPPDLVGVVGGGRMGTGIAHAFLVRGSRVVLVEADPARLDVSREAVTRALHTSVDRGTAQAPVGQMADRLDVTSEMTALTDAGIVIEAVPEDVSLKNTVLHQVSEHVGPAAVIASNTSSMSISSLADAVTDPGRFLGLHFFNPVPASQLVEVVVGRQTTEQTIARANEVVTALGKVAVTVADSPGFASSRLGVALGLEAIRMVEDGVATPADIDAAMTLGYKHPVGPLKLTDLVGLDVRLGIADYLAQTLGPRFEPPQLLRDMVSRGEVGRKAGRGFYDWTTETKETR